VRDLKILEFGPQSLIDHHLAKVEGFGVITLVGKWELEFSIQEVE
jgi:hypothetical protein